MKSRLKELFLNPPKGGNDVGLPTQNRFAGAQAEGLQQVFDAGVTSAKNGIVEGVKVAVADVRNVRRDGSIGEGQAAGSEVDHRTPQLQLNPDMSAGATRTDGKPSLPWRK